MVPYGSIFHSSSHKDGIALVNSLCPEPQQLKPHPGLSDRRSVRGKKKKSSKGWLHPLAITTPNFGKVTRLSKFWFLEAPIAIIATATSLLGGWSPDNRENEKPTNQQANNKQNVWFLYILWVLGFLFPNRRNLEKFLKTRKCTC